MHTTICRFVQYILDRDYDFHITCSELLDRLEKVQECIVIAKVNGEQLKPVTTILQLESPEKETWETVTRLMTDMKKTKDKNK